MATTTGRDRTGAAGGTNDGDDGLMVVVMLRQSRTAVETVYAKREAKAKAGSIQRVYFQVGTTHPPTTPRPLPPDAPHCTLPPPWCCCWCRRSGTWRRSTGS